QRAHSSHLPLVFIVAAITFVRRDSAIGLLLHPADPVLGEPGLTRVAENVGVGTAGLIGIANVPVAVAVNEIFFLGLFKGMVQFIGQHVVSAHPVRQSCNVMRYTPSGLP